MAQSPQSPSAASRPTRRAARTSAATTLALAFVLGTSSVAGYHGIEAVAPSTRFDQLIEARAAARSYANATAELARTMNATARGSDRLDHEAQVAIEGGRLVSTARTAPPDAMIADALALIGVATERGRAIAVTAEKRGRLGVLDRTTTGSVGGEAPVRNPDGSAPKRDRLAPAGSTETNIERSAKRGRLLVSASPVPSLADPVSTATLEPWGDHTDFASLTLGNEVLMASALQLPAPVFAELPKTAPMPFTVARDRSGEMVGTMLTAYAPIVSKDYSARARFDALLQREGSSRFVPQLGKRDHAWAARPLPANVMSKRQQHCLATGIYFEARGEPKAGQAAVAQVILNRVRAPSFPNTVCGVVYQNSHWRNRCQFSFTCDGIKDRVRSPRHWRIAQDVARAATIGTAWFADVGSSTHYHADYVNPRWNRKMARVAKIGRHVFYRTRRGGWD